MEMRTKNRSRDGDEILIPGAIPAHLCYKNPRIRNPTHYKKPFFDVVFFPSIRNPSIRKNATIRSKLIKS